MLTTKFAALSMLLGFALAAPTENTKLKRPVGKVIPDSYIVVLKKDASVKASVKSLNDLVFTLDDTSSFKEVTNDDWTVLNGYSAKLGGAALEHVLADPNVDYVEPNGVVTINWEPQEREAAAIVEREAEAAGVPQNIERRAAGAGTSFYSIDTGARVTHTSFTGRASFLAVYGGYAAADGNGHGTHTTGTAAGVNYGPATSASIYAIKVLSDSGSGSFADVISGINRVTSDAPSRGRPAVANMSLGGSASSSVDSAVSNSIAAGIVYTIAAGNSNVDAASTSPARVTAAITVGALDSSNRKASFSNYGAVVDCWYLGVNVLSAWSTSDTATNTISGTSMAAPGVAGLALVYRGNNPSASPATVQSAAKAAAVSGGASGVPSGTTTARCVAF